MSGLYNHEQVLNLFGVVFPTGVFIASLLGSLHCLSMCGGLVMVATKEKQMLPTGLYHLFRLLGYLVLGSLAGYFGQSILGAADLRWVSLGATVFIALTLLVMGLRLFQGKSIDIKAFKQVPYIGRLWGKAMAIENPYGKASSMGFLTAMLPCGWLYGFVVVAIGSQSIVQGTLVMVFFWLGTIPILIVGPEVLKSALAPVARRAPKVAGGVFIALAIATVAIRVIPKQHSQDRGVGQGQHCHE